MAKWETPTADMQARFDAMIDAQRWRIFPQADAALIEGRRAPLDGWVCFSLRARTTNDVILLAYQALRM